LAAAPPPLTQVRVMSEQDPANAAPATVGPIRAVSTTRGPGDPHGRE
jgi:hypothetical protein